MASLAVLLAVVVAGGSLVIYAKWRSAWDGIKRVNVAGDLHSKTRPPTDPNAENLLLIGGSWGSSGNGSSAAGPSDTDMLVHIAPGAHSIVVMSFPRDSVVPILGCTAEGGSSGQNAQPSYDVEQLNAPFAYGGPGCLWETIEQTTGIHINDFVELSFAGFEQVINDLNGVNVCLPEAVNDPVSGLNLSAGEHRIYGVQALEFWRTREDLGMGTDPQRIQRDQFLMASLFQGIEHSSLLHSPSTMLSVIDTLTSHGYVTTDTGLTPSVMLRLAEALRGIHGDSLQFVTVPWTTYTGNAQWINSSETPTSGNINWVQWQQPQANQLFSAIAHDTKLPTTTPSASASPALSPAQVAVQVMNGTSTHGLATSTAASLSQRGFDVVGAPTDAAASTYTSSVIEYKGAAQLPAAQTLAQVIGNVTLKPDPSLPNSTLNLILGSTFSSLIPAGSTGSSSGISDVAATYGGITGSVNICDDQKAFSGPNGGG